MLSAADLFVFDRYQVLEDNQTIYFYFRIELADGVKHELCEIIKLPKPVGNPSTKITKKLLVNLHIGLGISYYKIFLPPKFITPYKLNEQAADFWNIIYRKGLAEFLYTNSIDPNSIARFETAESNNTLGSAGEIEEVWEESALLGIGGGKDSIVGGELLKQIGLPAESYVLATGEQHGQASALANGMGFELWGVERIIDPKIFDLNEKPGAMNGHVPISMIFAFVGLLLSSISRSRYVIVNNESSASIPNTIWHDLEVNHQWSKSLEFEKMLQDYVHSQISADLDYFSVIRPLSSVAVCKLAATYTQYLPTFTSCNLVFRIDPSKRPNDRWCGRCAKCLSSYIMLLPWLSGEQMMTIFGADLLNDPSHAKLFLELTGLEGHKPLDCVGTSEEMTLSLNLAEAAGKNGESVLMKLARERKLIQPTINWDEKLIDLLELSPDHAIPDNLAEKLLPAMKAAL